MDEQEELYLRVSAVILKYMLEDNVISDKQFGEYFDRVRKELLKNDK